MNHAPATPRANSQPVKMSSAKLAVIIALASETFFFATLISTYLFIRASDPTWKAMTITPARLAVPLANTLILLLSALTVFMGYRVIQKDRPIELARWFTLSLALGLVFVGGQVLEYTGQHMLPGQMTGGVFLAVMGFHALHMVAGIVVLAIALSRALQGGFSARNYGAVELSSWFWYFVVAVWIVLFTSLYLI